MSGWDDAAAVVVFSLGAPRQRLMGWFLRDSGIGVELTDTLEETLDLIRERPFPVLVVNTTVVHSKIAAAVEQLRAAAPDMRVIVLHAGRHNPDDPEIPADICIHDVSDPDRLVETVRAALADDLPAEEEPHKAAEELV